jgi:hypothetical protein
MYTCDREFGLVECEHRSRLRSRVLAVGGMLLVAGSGCGFDSTVLRSEPPVEILRGTDSAGATIELEKRGDDLTAARVIDVVLGTGEAEIISDKDGYIEFTIGFPAGATITYFGTVQDPGVSSAQAIAGTWRQHSAGIFGEDTGTWEAATDPA